MGPAIDKGELALGRNALVALRLGSFNYEDAINSSEAWLAQDAFFIIHYIEDYTN